jgi:hypothetical protein
MPIPAELRRTFYGPKWRKEIRLRILERAGNCCERCSVPNYTEVKRHGGSWLCVSVKFGRRPELVWIGSDGLWLGRKPTSGIRKVMIVLQVIHLNHTPGDDRDDNLAAYCQWCHLNYDQVQHKLTRSVRKDAERPLLAMAEVLEEGATCAPRGSL